MLTRMLLSEKENGKYEALGSSRLCILSDIWYLDFGAFWDSAVIRISRHVGK